jgi:alpha-N-arabinofuranosidase
MKFSAIKVIILSILFFPLFVSAQKKVLPANAKPISTDLFGIFFEDISYAADGGLYAELIQNRSFEYSPGDLDAWNKNTNWNALTAWKYTSKGYAYGNISIESKNPVHPNNPHYITIHVEDAGTEGIGLTNSGFDGIAIKKGEKYHFSAFIQQLSGQPIPFEVKILGKKGDTLALASFTTDATTWKKYTTTLTATETDDSCSVAIIAKSISTFNIDLVSMFPENTFKNEANGLRADLAQTIANIHPKFMRFPGGCLVHGDGLGNMYRWKNTIGPVEERVEQKNIWNYHQTAGLGFYEYFRFCEDIGAKPLPIVAAGVSCQNSGGTWRIGSNGQKALPMDDIQQYIQDVLDLVEYANGPATSTWGAKRAAAGHPQPFGLQYIGIGNEDKQTDAFRERFEVIYKAVHSQHPEITVVGTAGPSPDGEDYELGWKFANKMQVQVVDEHYYQKPEWFLGNGARYDGYDRTKSKVYVGEYASWGNTLFNALAEAAYMTSLERNGDVVQMASYAPLLANTAHTSWNPNLIYFTNTRVLPTINYYVQQLFATNEGDYYVPNIVSFDKKDTLLAASCVADTKTGDVIIKIVNAGAVQSTASINLKGFGALNNSASATVLTGNPTDKATFDNADIAVPVTSTLTISKSFTYPVKPYSLTVLRVKKK